MPTYIVTTDDGKKYRVTTDAPATPEELEALVPQFLASPETPPSAEAPAPEPAGTRADFVRDMTTAGRVALREAPGIVLPSLVGLPPGAGVVARTAAAAGLGAAGRTVGRLLADQELPSLDELGREVGLSAGGELGATALTRGAARVGRLLRGGDVPEEALGAAEAVRRHGLRVTPAQINPKGVLPGADLALSRLPGSRGVIQATTDEQMAQLPDALDASLRATYPQAFRAGGSVTAQEAGEVIQRQTRPLIRALKHEGSRKFKAAEQAARTLGLASPPNNHVAKAAGSLLDTLEGGLESAQSPRLRRVLQEMVEANQGGTAVPFERWSKWQRDLDELLPSFGRRGFADRFSVGAEEHLHGLVREEMERLATNTPVAPLLQEARTFWREEVAPLRTFGKSLVSERLAPKDAVTRLVQTRDPRLLERYMARLSPDDRALATVGWFEGVLEKARATQAGDFNPGTFLREWNKLGSRTQDVLTGGQRSDVTDLIHLMRQMKRTERVTRSSRTTEGAMAAGVGAGVGLALAHGQFKTAAGILLGSAPPHVVATFITRPGVARALAIGLREETTGRQVGRTATRLGTQLAAHWEQAQQEGEPESPPSGPVDLSRPSRAAPAGR